MMGLYFTRHGQTDWNIERRLQGKSDIPLNATGIAQAKKTKEALQEIRIDKIYTSPLMRAKKTAELINEGRNITIYEEKRLMERGFGIYEGKLRKDILISDIWVSSDIPLSAGGEDTNSFFKRVEEFLDEIIEESQMSNLLLVSHGGVGIPFQCYFDGYHCVEHLAELIIDNCEVVYKEKTQDHVRRR